MKGVHGLKPRRNGGSAPGGREKGMPTPGGTATPTDAAAACPGTAASRGPSSTTGAWRGSSARMAVLPSLSSLPSPTSSKASIPAGPVFVRLPRLRAAGVRSAPPASSSTCRKVFRTDSLGPRPPSARPVRRGLCGAASSAEGARSTYIGSGIANRARGALLGAGPSAAVCIGRPSLALGSACSAAAVTVAAGGVVHGPSVAVALPKCVAWGASALTGRSRSCFCCCCCGCSC
mmetsp:Transcript_16119/g.43822  ORF Transcript_16119/g.43822 Transcript_16119/m.43822 type:complete len:233 (-) Transcript_16119:115-813(-)